MSGAATLRTVGPLRDFISARLLLSVLAALVLAACAGTQSEFDRIEPPVRFGELRETAAWVPGFDPQWWRRIDAAYDEYDRGLDDALVARWNTFSADVSDERVRGQTPDVRRARALAGERREIDRLLGEREGALIAAMEWSLPREAEPYIGLVAARVAFERASSLLRDPAQRLPGPLEVMPIVGRRTLTAEQVAEVTAGYRRLADVAESAVRARVQRFIALCGDIETMEGAHREAEIAERNAGDDDARNAARAKREAADAERERRTRQWTQESAGDIEPLRLALLREGRAFARTIADAELQGDFLEEIDASLHDGMRSAPGMRAFARIARIAIARAHPGDEAALAEFDRTVEQELERQRTLRITLGSGSKDARRKAYEALKKVGDPIGAIVDRQLKEQGGVWRVLERTIDVMAGLQDAESAAEAVLAPNPPTDDAQEPPPQFVAAGHDRNLQILLGCPLEPQALLALAARLRLGADADAQLKALYERESSGFEAVGNEVGARVRADFDALGRDGANATASAMVVRFMGRLNGHIAQLQAADRAANDRMLAEAARLAGVAPDDARIAITRLELDLLAEVGVSRGAREAEPIVGVVDAAVVNPLELARAAARDDGERAAAEDIVLGHADELRAAHRALATAIRANLRDFLVFVVESRSMLSAAVRWRPKLAGEDAAALRIALADEFRRAIGDGFADRYEARLRAAVAPRCEPARPAAFMFLDRYAAGNGLGAGERDASADVRAVIAELLDGADERRAAALRRLVAWRARWVRIGEFNDAKSWTELQRVAPAGWLLRARAEDADERALAACESALDFAGAPAAEVRALRSFPVALPRRMAPNFE